ncbi:MAG: hypothetical protein ACOYXA_08960 [Bacteroidota bacterium]
MITSRPKAATLSSFILFTALLATILSVNVRSIVQSTRPAWYQWLMVVALSGLLIFVTYRIFIRYKVLRFGSNQVEIYYPVLRKRKKFPLADIERWQEQQVKTGKKTTYRELQILFTGHEKLSLGQQEFSDYEKILKYLSQKCASKRKG